MNATRLGPYRLQHRIGTGGMGTALGPFLGSILITSLETYLRATFSNWDARFAGIYTWSSTARR